MAPPMEAGRDRGQQGAHCHVPSQQVPAAEHVLGRATENEHRRRAEEARHPEGGVGETCSRVRVRGTRERARPRESLTGTGESDEGKGAEHEYAAEQRPEARAGVEEVAARDVEVARERETRVRRQHPWRRQPHVIARSEYSRTRTCRSYRYTPGPRRRARRRSARRHATPPSRAQSTRQGSTGSARAPRSRGSREGSR